MNKITFDGGTIAVERLESTDDVVLLVETTAPDVVRGIAIGQHVVRIPMQLDVIAAHRLCLELCTHVKAIIGAELVRRGPVDGGS